MNLFREHIRNVLRILKLDILLCFLIIKYVLTVNITLFVELW